MLTLKEWKEDIENKYDIQLHIEPFIYEKDCLKGNITSKSTIMLRIGKYVTEHRNGANYYGVSYDNQQDHCGSSCPCNSLDEVYKFLDKFVKRKSYEQMKLF